MIDKNTNLRYNIFINNMVGGDLMKEAAGEANMTVITIVLIGVVAAVGAILIPSLLTNMSARSCCQQMGGTVDGGNCVVGTATTALKTFYTNNRAACDES